MSVIPDGRVTKLERMLLGFIVAETINTPSCIETIAMNSQTEYPTFKMDGQTKTLTQVVAMSTVTLVLEAASDSTRALTAWTCWQGLASPVASQSFKVLPAPSVIISISLVGLKSIAEVTKEMEASIIRTFAKVLVVPLQAVSIEAGVSGVQRRLNDQASTAHSDTGHGSAITTTAADRVAIATDHVPTYNVDKHGDNAARRNSLVHIDDMRQASSQQGVVPVELPASTSLEGQGMQNIQRRNTGVIVRVRILTTSQSNAELLAQKASTTASMAELVTTLAESGISVEPSSITATVVQPLNNPSTTSGQIDGQTTSSNSTENNAAIIAGSVSGGVCLLVAVFTFVFIRHRNKRRAASQLFKGQSLTSENTPEHQPEADLPQSQDAQPLNNPNQAEILGISVPVETEQKDDDDGDSNQLQPLQFAGATQQHPPSNITVFEPISAGHHNVEVRWVAVHVFLVFLCVLHIQYKCDHGKV
jgi:hypothetical protein